MGNLPTVEHDRILVPASNRVANLATAGSGCVGKHAAVAGDGCVDSDSMAYSDD